jgi:hypothetical protein
MLTITADVAVPPNDLALCSSVQEIKIAIEKSNKISFFNVFTNLNYFI